MDIMDFLRTRRSIRKYTDEPVPEEIVRLLLEAGHLAPSRANSQPWKFVVVTDPHVKQQLYDAVYCQKLVLEAPLLIAVLGVIDPRKSVPLRTRELVDAGCFGEDVKDFADHVLDDWAQTELKTDAALNSAIAATHIMLAAHGLGLGCCWIKLCMDDKVLELLGVPSSYYHTGILAIGYPAESPKARPRLPLEELVFDNQCEKTLVLG
jgi:nitroreductase